MLINQYSTYLVLQILLFRWFVKYQFLSTIFCDQIMVLLVMLYIVSTSFREWGSSCACPYTDKQRLIKIPLKCLKAFLAPAFIKIPTLFLLAQYIYHNFVWRTVYIEVVIYYLRFWAWFSYSQSLSLTPPLLFFVPLPSAPPTKPFHMWVWCWRNYTQNRVQYWK